MSVRVNKPQGHRLLLYDVCTPAAVTPPWEQGLSGYTDRWACIRSSPLGPDNRLTVNNPTSVLWYCWLGLLTCKNRLPYNLYCVGGDAKHCSIQSNPIVYLSLYFLQFNQLVCKQGGLLWPLWLEDTELQSIDCRDTIRLIISGLPRLLENSRTWRVLVKHFGFGKSWKLKLKVLEIHSKISWKITHFYWF